MIVQLCNSTAIIVQCNRELFTGAVDAIIAAGGGVGSGYQEAGLSINS